MRRTKRTSSTAILRVGDVCSVSAARGRPIASVAGSTTAWYAPRVWRIQTVLEKPQLLELVRSGRVRHGTYEAQIERMVRHGDVVIVMGRDTVTDPPDGTISRRRHTNVWRLHDGIWKSIARHANVLPRDPPAGP